MSWQLASLVVVSLAVAFGTGWFERSRPPARVVALVAALAALAVVGRIAFAPIPNVKPTTDIVLLSGYALGGAPGFAVGAVTALVSNFFFGQGPWTPWQMAGWGAAGLLGAGLARLAGGRELGRVPLAIACGAAGFAFGVVMDTFHWTLAAEQSVASFVAVSGASLPYNLAHVIGNVAFCMLIGPPFVRAVRRYRRRFEFSWAPAAAGRTAGRGRVASAGRAAALGRAAGLSTLAALALAISLLGAVPAEGASAGDRAVRYLRGAQNPDGGFGGARGQGSTSLYTGWSALGLAAAGKNPATVRAPKRSILNYIGETEKSLTDTGELERTILVVRAAGRSPHAFAGRDLVAELRRRRRTNGSFGGLVNLTAFGVLAMRAAGHGPASPAVRGSVRWLTGQQNRDGGWGFAPSAASDVDDTGAVLQALGAAGRGGSRAGRRAVALLRRAQHSDGGFGSHVFRSSNAQSTAFAVQGLVAFGRNPERFRRGRRSPLDYLRSLQARDGSIRYSRTSAQTPVWVTAQALLALERAPFPLRPLAVDRRRAGSAADRSDDGGGAAGGRRKRARDRDRPAGSRSAGPARAAKAPEGRESPFDFVFDRVADDAPGDAGSGGSAGGRTAQGALVAAAATGLVLGLLWRRRRRAGEVRPKS